MTGSGFAFKSGKELSSRSILIWRIIQTLVWLVGVGIVFCLLFYPTIGLLVFWNILIPIAPLLFVLATGVWRNICPMATTQLFPRHMGWSKKKRLTLRQLGKLNLISVFLLFLIVPLRHAIFNNNGMATALLLIISTTVAVALGFRYEWKSAWCSGLCPVHPVEKLYGGKVMMALPNAHCGECMNCVIPCPDSTAHINPSASIKTIYHQISGLLIIGGLPGFIWGWFHVPDEANASSLITFLSVYIWPLSCFTISLVIYAFLMMILGHKYEQKLINIFAAAGVSCYYWYRIPSLFGFGKFANDGLLIDLNGQIPEWIMPLTTILSTGFFFYWLVIRKEKNTNWVIRPPFANKRVIPFE